MNKKYRVSIDPEKVEELKAKHGVSDEVLSDYLRAIHVEGEAEPEEEEELPSVLGRISRGEIGLGESLLIMEYWDRKDRREERQLQQQQPQITTEAITKAVAESLKELLPKTKEAEEMPEWAKSLQTQQTEILQRLASEAEEKKEQAIIEKAQTPLLSELEKERTERQRLQEELKKFAEKVEKPAQTPLQAAKEAVEFTDKIRPAPEASLPAGTPAEVQVATKTLGVGEKVVTQAMDKIDSGIGQWIEWQIAREKRAFQATAPKLPELTPEERLKALQQAAGEAG